MFQRWLLPFVFLMVVSDAGGKDRAVELSAGGGIYFPSNDDYDFYFGGQAANFSLQLAFLGKSGFDFKLGGDFSTKTQERALGRDYFANLYDLRLGFAFRVLPRRRVTPFLGGGATLSEARGGEKPDADLKARSLGGYVEGGVRYQLSPRFFAALEAWQDFRKGKVQSIESTGPFSFQADESTDLGGSHIGLRVGVRLGK